MWHRLVVIMPYDINDPLPYIREHNLSAEQEKALRAILDEDAFVILVVNNSLAIPAVPSEMRMKASRAKKELTRAAAALKALSFDARANVETLLIRPGSLSSVQNAIDAAVGQFKRQPVNLDREALAGGLAWLAHYFKITLSTTEGSQFVDLAQVMLDISGRDYSPPELARRAKQMYEETDLTGIPQYPESLWTEAGLGQESHERFFGRNPTGKF